MNKKELSIHMFVAGALAMAEKFKEMSDPEDGEEDEAT